MILTRARVTGNVVNTNQMNGANGGVTYGFLIYSNSNIGGAFTNSGTISGYNQGAFLQNSTLGGNVTNTATGVIDTAGVGFNLENVTAASLQNLSSIKSGSVGMRVEGGTLGVLLNSGTLTLTDANSVGVNSSGVVYNGSVTNSGAIDALATGIALSGGSVAGDVINTATGRIATTAATGTNVGMSVTNVAITSNLANDGSISGGGGAGAGRAGVSASGGSIGGNLSNSGTITGYTTGVSVSSTTITGAGTNTATGSITATGVGVNLSGVTAASLQNFGSVASVTQGLNVLGGTLGALLNSGTITTSGTASENNGIYLLSGARVTGALTNNNLVSGQAGAETAKTSGMRLNAASLVSATLAGAAPTADPAVAIDPAAVDPVAATVSLVNSGRIEGYNYGVQIGSSTVSGSVTNSGTVASVDSGIRVSSSTVGGDLINSGTITTSGTAATSDGLELQTVTLTGNLTNSGTLSGQAGTGGATTSGMIASGGSIGGAVTNSGTISGYDYGLRLTNTPIGGALTNSGGITSVADAVALSGSSIGGDVSNTASGMINAGGYGFNFANFGSMGAFANFGSIASGNSAMFASAGKINGDVLNAKMITTTGTAATSNGIELQTTTVTGSLINSGTMSGQAGTGGAITTGILANGGAIVGSVTNSGGVSGYNDGYGFSGTTLGGAIDNTGSVYASRYGFNLADAGTIGAFNNFGTIAAGVAGVNATGSTQILNMTNAQGVGNSAGPLTYSGVLPSNYFIVINGSSYGQLGVDLNNHSGRMTFAISSLSSGVAPRNYLNVLTGVSISDLGNPNSVQARFGDRGKLVLRQGRGSATDWDLRIEGLWNPFIGFNNPNIVSTYQALNANRMATEGVLHQRFAVLNAVMQYDCDRFDKYGLCLQFQTRETGFGTQSTGAGVINASYRLAERFRIGGYLDYQAWQRTPFGISAATGGVQPGYGNATYGAYVGYSQNDDQTGLQARLSSGHNSGRLSVIRAFLAGSEPGFGDARLNAHYVHGVAGYGVKLRDDTIVTPYAGLQYTDVTREAYMEAFASGTIFPLIYDPYYERLITGLAGMKLSGAITERLGYQAAMGAQIDFSRDANAYGGVSAAPGMEAFGVAHGGSWNGVRPSGMAGLSYAPRPNHRLSLNGYANQQAWTSRTYVTGLLGYAVGF